MKQGVDGAGQNGRDKIIHFGGGESGVRMVEAIEFVLEVKGAGPEWERRWEV